MRAGRVVKIRLEPQLCMACVDVVNKVGANRDGISFAQVVILALNSAVAAFKANGLIPDRDGFEYSSMMKPFKDQPHIDRARKLELTRIIQNMDVPAAPIVVNRELNKKQMRFRELAMKAEHDAVNMDEAERKELNDLVHELNPL